MFTSVAQVIKLNSESGRHFFSKDTMRFFNSRISHQLYGGHYFVTSEQAPGDIRRYSVRRANDDGSIDTVGKFQGYETLAQALAAAKRAARAAHADAVGG